MRNLLFGQLHVWKLMSFRKFDDCLFCLDIFSKLKTFLAQKRDFTVIWTIFMGWLMQKKKNADKCESLRFIIDP